MTIIKLMADYFCYPIWDAAPSINGDIPPDSLPISPSLQADLMAWAAQYDLTFNTDDPKSSGFQSANEADAFLRFGYQLLDRLKTELGSTYLVDHNIRARVRPQNAAEKNDQRHRY